MELISPGFNHTQFLRLLELKLETHEAQQVSIHTQVPASPSGVLDLVISSKSIGTLVIEVKVNSPENSSQLGKYEKWLAGKARHSLFRLVKQANPKLKQGKVIRWKTVARLTRDLGRKCRGTEGLMLRDFEAYLAEQGISKNLSLTKLRTQDELPAKIFFAELADRLDADGFKATRPEIKPNHWPKIMVGHPQWIKPFFYGRNERVSAWITWPGIWDATGYHVRCELEVWHRSLDSNWESARNQISSMLKVLKPQFTYDVYRDDWENPEREIPLGELPKRPQRIVAYRRQQSDIPIPKDDRLESKLFADVRLRIKEMNDLIARV